jgi:hypothetical protein
MLMHFCAAVCLLAIGVLPAQGQESPPAAREGALRVFLDCNYNCDENHLRREITFIDYMRDRKDADVHVLVTTQGTGGGGTEYTMKFIGLGRFQDLEHTIKYAVPQTSTSDERRREMTDHLKRGLVRYVLETPLASQLKVTFSAPSTPAQAGAQKDRWNLWVFRTSVGGSFNGEQSTNSRSFRGSASANRTTDAWKLSFSTSGNYRESSYDLSETETYTSVSRNMDASALTVKSLSPHWSAGLVGTASSSTYLNYDLRTRLAPGVEYNFFPYSESTRRMLTVQYTLGVSTFDYEELTIFQKTSERLLDHRLETSLSMRQPWGTASASVDFSQYLNKPDKYSISSYGDANVRLFKGFSFNMYGSVSRTRNQIYLAAAGATPEEILVRQRQLATGYQYYMSFGISYSFGSIFNNVVNPRFGGGGGDFFIMF